MPKGDSLWHRHSWSIGWRRWILPHSHNPEYPVSGSVLGTVGIDSITEKPQMNFMVFQNGQPIDPAKAPRS